MTFEKIKNKITCFFYPCQKQLNALTAEYNHSLNKLEEQVEHARSAFAVKKVASHNSQN